MLGCGGWGFSCRVGGVGGVTIPIIIPLRGPSCKLRLFRFSAKLKFQDGPSVAIVTNMYFHRLHFVLGVILHFKFITFWDWGGIPS